MSKQIMKKSTMKNQKGMTFISWVVVLAFIGFQFMLAIKIVPVFAEDNTIKTIWAALESDTTLVGVTPKKIRKNIMKKMKINSIYDFDIDSVSIKKSQGFYIVSTDYEPRGNIIGSLDFIVSFSHEAQIRAK